MLTVSCFLHLQNTVTPNNHAYGDGSWSILVHRLLNYVASNVNILQLRVIVPSSLAL